MAKEEKFDMGDRARGWWYLRQGRFTDEQRRWILGDDVRNDWAKVTKIQENAIGMPESLQGAAHCCDIGSDGIFHTKTDASGDGGEDSWETAYWNVYHSYKDTYEKYEQLVAAVAEDEIERQDVSEEYYDCETYYGDDGVVRTCS